MGTTRLLYARAVLQKAQLPRTTAHEQCLVAVMTGESSMAGWNPLDTTLPRLGATPYNSFGLHGEYHVWNYPSAVIGIDATVSTLLQSNMAPWVDILRQPRSTAVECLVGFARCPWGGVGDTLPLRIAQEWSAKDRSYSSDAHSWVSGKGIWPYRRNGKPLH